MRSLSVPSFVSSVLTSLLLSAVSASVSVGEGIDSSRFEATVLANGLIRPMELAVAPDGAIYFIELDGLLKVIDPQDRQIREVGKLTVTTEQENGLIGLALDPNFTQNRWVYLQYSPPEFSGQHISRFTLKDGVLDLSSEKLLFRYEEQRKECCHHAGALEFGPDGLLYIATGDNTHPHGDSQGYAPLDERPDKAPWDAQKSSANSRSGNGKILRIRPLPDGTCEIPDGNLFPKDGSKGMPEIYAMGCRNPWRMTVDQETGFVYWGEVGPDAGADGPRGPRGYDEINQARAAGNFGWPYFIANNRPYADYNYETGEAGAPFDADAPVNESVNNTGERILPPAQPALIYYPYGASEEFPEVGTGGRTACAGPVYHFHPDNPSPTKFPEELDRVLLIFEWTRNWVKLVHLDDNYEVAHIEPFMPQYSFVRPIDMEFGTDGSLYMIEYGETWGVNPDARLIRIDYVRGNRPPVVVAAAENNIGRHPLTVSLSGKGSYDKDADETLTWKWRLVDTADPDATPPVIATTSEAVVTVDRPGVYNAELVVTDASGASQSAAVPVVVGNERPQIRFVSPQTGDFFSDETPLHYQILVNDEEDGTNDDHAIDQEGAELIDTDSPGRVTLNAAHSADPYSSVGVSASVSNDPPGLKRMKASDCFNCHAVDQRRVGPQLLDIANKYRGKADALEASVQRVLKGSTGVWGKIPMIPHSHHTVEEIREMVGWVYSLEPAGLTRVFSGFAGEIPVSAEDVARGGHYRLEAAYTDRGAGPVPPLVASSTIYLRPRRVEAENADEVNGPQLLGSGNASGNRFVGAINHGHSLRFRNMNLDQFNSVTLRIASAGSGGAIELHADAPDGPLLGQTEIEVNGQWEQFYDRDVALTKTFTDQELHGRHDVFVVFTHPQHAGGLMNLDSLHFVTR
ncbi:MAG: PQQ-dependent sugar dehydrogenase [Planctomycetaceae bacterium]|nr:PQQ-dependent sugar dehydrogenase [Planctomycetaceae bacterium]